MKYIKLLSVSIAFFICKNLMATDIIGNVTDSEHTPLLGVQATLTSTTDSLKVERTATDIDGNFEFQKINPGEYDLKLSMLGFGDYHKLITSSDSIKNINLGNIILSEKAIDLDETIVTAIKAAIVAKQDTLEFNADSFHTSANGDVDELLKKLPGVEVSSDGSITANGKTVTKILVDGKEFFGNDMQMASKNLPSKMVNKVQVIDRKSDLARLTGVDDGEEETVINLTVKKDMQNSWFGNVGAGYGTDDRYQASFTVNNFTNGNQITILGGLNNVNESGYTDRGRGRFRDMGGSGGINTSQRIGVNFNIGKEEIIRLGGNILFTHSDRKVTRKSATQFFFPDSVSYQDASSKSTDKGKNLSSDFRLQWNINDNNTLDFRPRFSLNFRDTEQNDSSILRYGQALTDLVNTNYNFQQNKGNNFEISGNLIFNHKFANRPGRSFSINTQYSFTNLKQKTNSFNEIMYYLLQDSDEVLNRYIDNRNWSNNIDLRLTWTEPIGDVTRGNFLNFSYRFKYLWNNSDLFTYNLPISYFDPNYEDLLNGLLTDLGYDPTLSNSFRNKFMNQEIQLSYKKVSKSLNLETGLLFSPSMSQSQDLIDDARSIPKRNVFNVSPFANVRWKLSDRRSLRFNYRARTSQPSMKQLQPVEDVSNPLNIIVGNPELKPTFTQNLSFNFNDYNTENQQSLAMMLNTSYALNTIVNKTVTDPLTGGRVTTYTNLNGNFNIFFMGLFARPIKQSKFRFNLRLNTRYALTPGYINGDFNRTSNLNISLAGGLTYSSDILQIDLNPNYNLGNIKNSLPNQNDRQTHSYGFNFNTSLFLPFGIEFNSNLNYSGMKGYSQGFDTNQWLWNLTLSYSLMSDKSLVFSLKGYDILSQKKNISRSVGDNSIVDTEVNDLTRYVMLSVTWNFNTLKRKMKNQPEDYDMPSLPDEIRPGFRREGRQGGRNPQGPPPPGMPPRL